MLILRFIKPFLGVWAGEVSKSELLVRHLECWEMTFQWCSFWNESMYLGSKYFILHHWLAVLHIYRNIKDFLNFPANLENTENWQKSFISLKICNTASHLQGMKSLKPRYIDSYQNEHHWKILSQHSKCHTEVPK